MIPYGKQEITQQDIDAVVDVLNSDFLTQGPKVPEFEKSLTDFSGVKHAFAVNSATSALHIACLALGVEKGDVVWTTPITFVASANCALYCGADIDFVDIDPNTYNLSPSKLKEKLEHARAQKLPLPKVVIPVHLCGQSCDMKAIADLSVEYGFSIIEDASHAIGGSYQGHVIGSCKYSDITVLSFHPVKIITTAEGGAALTNSDKLAEKMTLFRSHGITRDPALMQGESDGSWYYQQIELGFNYRMTELQAALGVSQMSRLSEFVIARHLLANRYNELLSNLPLILPYQLPDTYSGLHLYVIRLHLDKISKTHKQVFDELRANGIGVNLHYIPVHIQPYYQKLGFDIDQFPESERYYQEAISIPLFHAMTDVQQNTVIAAIRAVVK
ncbi:MAG: UDP-4-amino-4,6-dideoxy-N-acetyl-beta-L-altrosamine transaminase [Oleiphilaceae bacterium]|jgi:UDP-4-amino-4,6-dideoxy-N-acetyl-beta-L-altrosamine transaminase